MLKLLVTRDEYGEQCTMGRLFIDGVFFCYTLEDVVRQTKIAGITAIPAGTYKCIINMSNRFKKLMPLLLDVPNYDGIRMHSGNTAADTLGCILVGYEKRANAIYKSRPAFYDLMLRLDGKPFELTIE